MFCFYTQSYYSQAIQGWKTTMIEAKYCLSFLRYVSITNQKQNKKIPDRLVLRLQPPPTQNVSNADR